MNRAQFLHLIEEVDAHPIRSHAERNPFGLNRAYPIISTRGS